MTSNISSQYLVTGKLVRILSSFCLASQTGTEYEYLVLSLNSSCRHDIGGDVNLGSSQNTIDSELFSHVACWM